MTIVNLNDFHAWHKKNEGLYSLKRQIINDKLKIGINGIEWLVLNLNPKQWKYEALQEWIEDEKEFGKFHYEEVMCDSLIMNSDDFFLKHKSNWWMAVDLTLLYLHSMKQNDYDRYFDFLQEMQSKK